MRTNTHKQAVSIIAASCALNLFASCEIAQAQSITGFGDGAEIAPQARKTSDTVASQGIASRSGFSSLTPQFQLLADTDKTTASLSLAFELDGSVKSSGNERIAISDRFLLKASAPLSGGSETSVFSFNGIADGTAVTLGWSRFSRRFPNAEDHRAFAGEKRILATKACVEKVAKNAPTYLDKFRSEARDPTKSTDTILEELAKSDDPKIKKIGGTVSGKCIPGYAEDSPGDHQELIREYLSQQDEIEFTDKMFGTKPMLLLGIDATVGQKQFAYLDVPAFADKDVSHTSYEASAYFGLIGSSADWSLRAKGSYALGYKGRSSVTICQPIPGGVQSQCKTGANGAPRRKEGAFGAVEFRKTLSLGKAGLSIGIAPEFTYDVKEKDFAVDVPIYLVPDKDGKLTGGLRIGYRNDTKDVGVGLFVGVPFSVF
jgi:hypothetical protein